MQKSEQMEEWQREAKACKQRCQISEFILNSEFFHSQFPQFYLFLARFGSICPNLRIFSEFLSGTHWHLCVKVAPPLQN